MYQALYRKWRPQTFDQVVGQKHITETLKNQVKTGRLSHAYIFIGTRGTGKTTCARILARAVNCEHPVDGNPCGVCAACRGIADGSVLDVVELDAASNNGVDNVRALREEAVFSPAAVKKRVYIIDEVHMLSTSAFNALLKILEEPPEHLLFILATTELQKVPATILSRCQRHSFKRIDTAEIADYLEFIAKEENFSLERDAAELIARLAEGGVRDALSLLDQCSASEKIDLEAVYSAMGLAGNRRIVQLMDHILRHDTESALKEFSGMWMDGKDPVSMLNELSSLLRDALMLHVAPKGAMELISGGFDAGTLREFAKRMTTEELLSAMSTVQSAVGSVKDAKNPKTAAELCLVSLCDDTAGESIVQLRARISRLERMLEEGEFNARPSAPRYEEPDYDYYDDMPEPPERYADEPEFDDLGAEVFIDEPRENKVFQPRKPTETLRPAEPVKAPEPVRPAEEKKVSPTVKPSGMVNPLLWKDICAVVSPQLPMDIRINLEDKAKVRGVIEGDVLRIEVTPGFMYGRFNRQEIMQKFADAARGLSQSDMRVILAELKQEDRKQRSLDELRAFKEVKFIN